MLVAGEGGMAAGGALDAAAAKRAKTRELHYSTVGTPDYIAPEVFVKNGYLNPKP